MYYSRDSLLRCWIIGPQGELILSKYAADSLTGNCRTFWSRRPSLCIQLTKTYKAEMSCNHSASYISAQYLFAIIATCNPHFYG